MEETPTPTPTRVIVITSPEHLTDDRRKAIEFHVSGVTGLPVVVLDGGAKLDVLDLPTGVSRADVFTYDQLVDLEAEVRKAYAGPAPLTEDEAARVRYMVPDSTPADDITGELIKRACGVTIE